MKKGNDVRLELDELLHPARAFGHPSEVVSDPDLTLNEKRAILASWASDACAIEAAPELRANPHGSTVRFNDIMDALKQLDREAANAKRLPQANSRRKHWKDRGRSGGGFLHA